MAGTDETARKARAQHLREQIKQLKEPQAETESASEADSSSTAETPRAFIHRKMRELEKKD